MLRACVHRYEIMLRALRGTLPSRLGRQMRVQVAMMRHGACASSPPTSRLCSQPILRHQTMAPTAARTARRAWVPVLVPGDDDVMRTKFGGRPYIPQGREWPLCPVSGEPLLFLCQLVARDAPLATDDPDTMLQFFARADAAAVRDDIHGSVLARAVRAPDRYPAPPNAIIPQAATLLESATVLRWEECSDYPDREEPEFASALAADGSGVGGACPERLRPISGIKVGGWPYWVRVTPGSLASRPLPPLALC
eukprot:COSAG02_NODE_226_length_28168_cov_64.619153_3_plen_252_part_00